MPGGLLQNLGLLCAFHHRATFLAVEVSSVPGAEMSGVQKKPAFHSYCSPAATRGCVGSGPHTTQG